MRLDPRTGGVIFDPNYAVPTTPVLLLPPGRPFQARPGPEYQSEEAWAAGLMRRMFGWSA
jgi:hypothetical protein